jgi:glycosyltransferase involved in cell wall biosynthesis
VGGVVQGARRAVPGARIYVVDDGSTDGTGEEGRGKGATVLAHRRNRGKGAALATGIARALADGVPLIVTMDADGQHPPELIPALLAPVGAGEADVVLGARARTGAMPAGRRLNNWLSAVLASRVGGQLVSDAQTGFRAFTRAVADAVRPLETRYDYEAAFLLGALARGFRIRMVPIPTVYKGAASHFRPWGDTWRLARVFARYGRRIVFGPR